MINVEPDDKAERHHKQAIFQWLPKLNIGETPDQATVTGSSLIV